MTKEVEVQEIPLSKMRPNPFQPRQNFKRESLEDLANSMKQLGSLQPIIVRPKDGSFQIACGERRWRAAQLAGLKTIPAIIKELDDKLLQLYSIVENIHRKDLESEEREKAIYDLWKKQFEPAGMSMQGMDRELGMSESYTSEHVQAYERRHKLNLPRGEVSTKDLRIVRALDDRTAKNILKARAEGKLSAKDVERIVPIVREAKPEKRTAIVHEVLKEHKKAEDFKEEVVKEAKAFGRGEIEEPRVKMVKDADLRRVDKFKELRDEVRFWTVASVEVIENERLRFKVVEHIESIRDYCDELLGLLKKRKWYGERK